MRSVFDDVAGGRCNLHRMAVDQLGPNAPARAFGRTIALVESMVEGVRGLLIGTALALLACCGGSSPTQPTPPTTPLSSIQISGPMVVATGGTVQLVATITTGGATTVASNASWQSQSPQIATVSSTGLVTGLSPGQATISATASGVTGQTFVSVQAPASGTTVLKACGTINAPGNYTLANDLLNGNGSCLSISNVAGVHLDCGGHLAPGMSLTNVSAVTITNCVVSAATNLNSVTTVTITRSTFNNGLAIEQSQSVIVSDSTITSPSVGVASNAGNDVELLRDVISVTGSTVPGGVVFISGSNDRVEQSTISSGYDGGPAQVGADDGILLSAEASDTIRGNTISAFYDAGVESVGLLTNTTIIDNTFSSLGNTAVGAYYCTDWTNNVVQGNHVSQSPTLVYVLYSTNIGPCSGQVPAPATFTNNQFLANVFRSPIHSMLNQSGRGPSMIVTLQTPGAVVSGNVLQNNDFASFDGPQLTPLNGFVDGGGNICGPLDSNFSNFACNGSGASLGRLALLRTRR